MRAPRPSATAGRHLATVALPLLLASAAGPPAMPIGGSAGETGASAPDATAPGETDRRVSADTLVPSADHHMHIWSPAAVETLVRAQEATDEEVIPPDRARPLTAANAVAALDSAGIRRGVVLSTAYFFGFPDLEIADEQARVRKENDYVARQVAAHRDRLTAFFSVNPLADYAFDEIERCAEKPAFTGLKLHLGNSNLDLGDPDHVRRLRDVFRKSNRLGLPIVIHLKNPRTDYGKRAVETFLEEILSDAPEVPVQVAHLAGDGGFDEATMEAVRVFARAIEERPELTRNLFFDYSATPIPTTLARGDSALLERVGEINGSVAAALRMIPPERLVYGTDWPAVSAPLYLTVRNDLPLEEGELAELLAGSAAYLR